MQPVKQKIVDKENGDCFRACMASMLELPNHDCLPHIGNETWLLDWDELLRNFGMSLGHDFKKIWRTGYWIATVPSLNFKNGLHAVIMKDSEVEFDPSTKQQYKKGYNFLKDYEKVTSGYWLEVDDVSRFKLLDSFREGLNNGR